MEADGDCGFWLLESVPSLAISGLYHNKDKGDSRRYRRQRRGTDPVRHQLCLAGPAINKGPPFLLLVTDYRFEGEEDELNLATPAATRLFPPAGG